YVLNTAPCPFLGDDNYCSIYSVRPRACREYPHTDRKNFHQILNLTLKNTAVCPATFRIVQRLKQALPV
ncbi:MAG: YkgJ family cysteine cluster protein, partial [Bacteroidota bacterium]